MILETLTWVIAIHKGQINICISLQLTLRFNPYQNENKYRNTAFSEYSLGK